jgi:magnesium chelatase family protein
LAQPLPLLAANGEEVSMSVMITSGAVLGVEGIPVRVEVDILRRLPAVLIVGLAASSVREAAERVRSAVTAQGLDWPRGRVVINLAPADLRKEGTAFDLPIAVGVLSAAGQIPAEAIEGRVLAGELSLSGALRPIRGALALALMARDDGCRELILPRACASEAAIVRGLKVRAAGDLSEVLAHLRGEQELDEPPLAMPERCESHRDLSEVRGQLLARRAMEIAAAGGHNLLMLGPPGCGKTMLAARVPTILPRMGFEEAIEVTRIHSVAGLRPAGAGLMTARPFRAPHHSITRAGMLGSARLRPGEASLAHHGVLFLDELPEFQRSVLELLRGPLEDRQVVLARALGTARFPAAFSLVAAANPCPCGYLGHPRRACGCSEGQVQRYLGRLSGPLLDRIDLHVELAPVSADELVNAAPGESSAAVRERVVAARSLQSERFAGGGLRCNADLDGEQVRRVARARPEALHLLRDFIESHALSGRAHARLLKVARTIADLEDEERVERHHLAEALQYRDTLPSDERRRPAPAPLPVLDASASTESGEVSS